MVHDYTAHFTTPPTQRMLTAEDVASFREQCCPYRELTVRTVRVPGYRSSRLYQVFYCLCCGGVTQEWGEGDAIE